MINKVNGWVENKHTSVFYSNSDVVSASAMLTQLIEKMEKKKKVTLRELL